MTYTSALVSSAALRAFASPSTVENRRSARWSHFAPSACQVASATFFGAITSTRRTASHS